METDEHQYCNVVRLISIRRGNPLPYMPLRRKRTCRRHSKEHCPQLHLYDHEDVKCDNLGSW